MESSDSRGKKQGGDEVKGKEPLNDIQEPQKGENQEGNAYFILS